MISLAPSRMTSRGISNCVGALSASSAPICFVAIDFPLNYPGIGQAYDILSKHGFFMGGFVPYHFSDVLGFRFQFLVPTKVDFANIKIYSETAKKIFKMVREDYERNTIL